MIAHFPSIAALTPEASTLMLGFAGFGLATFSVGMKVGQIVEAAWWKGKLQEAQTITNLGPITNQESHERKEIFAGLELFHRLVLHGHRQNSIVCHLSHELDNSGAQFWLLDTDERAYKMGSFFRRCEDLDWLMHKFCIVAATALTR